ncbi:MAG TPA: HPr kinase/phosphorylase [Caulobacteraceae bacterium]|nr:HPr kinase/phosphorylase [Caulobacteraceae bacterium]
MTEIRHAGLIARRVGGYWRGALIEGPAGAGKSDLALRALARGWRLVADDRVLLFACAGRLFGRAPDALAGLIEVRGLDVVAEVPTRLAEVTLAARCEDPAEAPRLWQGERVRIEEIELPLLRIWPLAASAPDLLAHAVERFGGRGRVEYQAGRSR